MIDELLKKVCQSLEANHIPYMLSGSMAIGFYSVLRTTQDIDIVIQLNISDADKFLSDFQGFYFNKENVLKEIRQKGMFNLIDRQTSYKVDFIIRKDSEYDAIAFERKIKQRYKDFSIWVISAEDLIIAKLKWIQDYQSDRQINDIKNLLLNSSNDLDYIMQWVKKLQLKTYGLLLQ